MKPTNNPSPASSNEDLDRIVAELGPDVVRKLHPAFKLTAATPKSGPHRFGLESSAGRHS
jgi:hypothetical protein